MPNDENRNFTTLLEMQPGAEMGVSGWHRVTQDDITAFAKITKDEDPFHIDPGWARENSPLGTTIAFGFQTLSMLTYFLHQVFAELGIAADDDTQMFNFGFDRVRLPEPVPAGAEIRGRFSFGGARTRDAGGVEITVNVVVEIKDNEHPALVAQWLFVAVTQ
jgi:acyl dehydratase